MMKFEEPKVTDPVSEVRKVEQEKKHQLIGSKKQHKGHTLYEVNVRNQTIGPAKFEESTIVFPHEEPRGLGLAKFKDGSKRLVIETKQANRRKVLKVEGCIYISALNMKSLRRKLVKRGIIKIVDK